MFRFLCVFSHSPSLRARGCLLLLLLYLLSHKPTTSISPQCVQLASRNPPILAAGKEQNFVYALKSVVSQDPVSASFEFTRKIYTYFLTIYTRIVEDDVDVAPPFGNRFPVENRRMTNGEVNLVDVSQL